MASKRTRRQFVKDSAALVAGTTIVGLGTNKAAGKLPPSERVNLGFIGMGGMAQGHLGWFKDQPDVRVAAVCDVDSRHLNRAKSILGHDDFRMYDDFRELVAGDDIDAVVVATPDHWHALATIAAAKAGKDIYCEKPLTNSVGEGIAVRDAVQKYKRILQTGSHERSNPGATLARKLINEGRFGKIHTLRIQLPTTEPHLQTVVNFKGTPAEMPVPKELDFDFWLGHTPVVPYTEKRCHFWWRFITAHGGGEMTDRGCHVIDLAQFVLGKDGETPVEFDAKGNPPPADKLYNAVLDFECVNKYADGLVMHINNDGPRGVWFEGDAGKLFVEIHGGKLSSEPASLLEGVEQKPPGNHPLHRRNFLDAVKTRGETVAPVTAGHSTATICHLNNIGIKLGRPFQWDPKKERSNDDEVNRMLTPQMRGPWSLS